MRHIREIDEFGAQYANAALEPLCVRAVMVANTPVTHHPDAPLRLDGTLAWSVVKQALAGGTLDDTPEPVWVPLPVLCLWLSETGQPLWAASALLPTGGSLRGTPSQSGRSSVSRTANIGRMPGAGWHA